MTENLSGPDVAKADTKGLWETFRPIRSIEEANQLLRAALFAGLIVFAQIVIEFIRSADADTQGARLDPSMTNGDALDSQMFWDGTLTLVIAAAVWGVMYKRSRLAAITLLVVCSLNFLATVVAVPEMPSSLKWGTVMFSATAVFLSVQALRALNANRRFNVGTAAPG